MKTYMELSDLMLFSSPGLLPVILSICGCYHPEKSSGKSISPEIQTMFIVGSQLPLFVYNCVPYGIIELNTLICE